jgi:hypothetical protein
MPPMYHKNQGASVESAKAWTESMSWLRVKKVPNMVSKKVRQTSTAFQRLSMLRRSWIITECKNAVAVNHGMSPAFSTGSHIQKPPQPSSW